MKIGIDVDGVLIDFEERLRYKADFYDILINKKEEIDKRIILGATFT